MQNLKGAVYRKTLKNQGDHFLLPPPPPPKKKKKKKEKSLIQAVGLLQSKEWCYIKVINNRL